MDMEQGNWLKQDVIVFATGHKSHFYTVLLLYLADVTKSICGYKTIQYALTEAKRVM